MTQNVSAGCTHTSMKIVYIIVIHLRTNYVTCRIKKALGRGFILLWWQDIEENPSIVIRAKLNADAVKSWIIGSLGEQVDQQSDHMFNIFLKYIKYMNNVIKKRV